MKYVTNYQIESKKNIRKNVQIHKAKVVQRSDHIYV